MKKGALHRQLKINPEHDIPNFILKEVLSKDVGKYVVVYGNRIPVTKLLKQRARFAMSFR